MKIKVIHIITKLELGGAQQNTLYTVKNLNRDIFEPVLITGTGGILDEEAKRIEGVKVYFVPELVREINPAKDIIALFKIAGIFRCEVRSETVGADLASAQFNDVAACLPNGQAEPCSASENNEQRTTNNEQRTIVHTHSSKAGIIGRWAARLAGIPIIIHTFHGFGFNDFQPFLKRWFFTFLEQLTSKITSHFICVSRANIEKGEKLGIFVEKEVSLIRSGIELDRFNPLSCLASDAEKLKELKIKNNLPITAPIIGMIACFKPQKAPLDFIRIAAKVKKEIEAKFVLVGDGQLRKEIEVEIEKLNLKNDVILAGWQLDIPQVLKNFDLLILTSLWEGLPRVLPEAIASDIPVIATDVDGANEVIQDGVNGYLLKPHDIDGFAEKIVYLLKNKTVLESFKKAGKEILAEFDINDMVKKQEKLYLSLLNFSGN